MKSSAVRPAPSFVLSSADGEIARLDLARSFRQRTIGLLGRNGLEPKAGLMFRRCRRVHTLGMRFEIDVIFIDSNDLVVALETLRPGRISQRHPRGVTCVELASGFIETARINVGDKLRIEPAS